MTNGAAAVEIEGVPPIVLIVEDDRDTREMYSLFLENSGLWVATARGADEAIHTVAEIRPNIVVTDFALEGALTGADLIHTIKSSPITEHIPVVLISGRSVDDLPDTTRREADLLLVKPINLELLLDHIREVLAKSRHLRQRGDSAINRAHELTERSTRVQRRAYEINAKLQRAKEAERERCCPQCGAGLDWIDHGWLNGVHFNYYRPCANGCGLYCFDQGGNVVKLA
jgi:DNA-binding response OmpR family regulator